MEIEELAKQLEGRKWQQMVGVLNKYTLEVYTEALKDSRKSVDEICRKINEEML